MRRGASVATAESLTAGRIVTALTQVPGASRCVAGGVAAYFARTKHDVLGVPAEVVEELGTVSAACAAAMAEAAARLFGAAYGVSATGVAGPDPEEGKPVGLVYVGASSPGGTRTRELRLAGDRAAITAQAVDEALALLAEVVGDAAPERGEVRGDESGLG